MGHLLPCTANISAFPKVKPVSTQTCDCCQVPRHPARPAWHQQCVSSRLWLVAFCSWRCGSPLSNPCSMMLESYGQQSMGCYLTAPERLSLIDLQKQVHGCRKQEEQLHLKGTAQVTSRPHHSCQTSTAWIHMVAVHLNDQTAIGYCIWCLSL